MKTKRILVVSYTPWNTNNSFGNSYANIFDGLPGVEIANIYCMEGEVNDPLVKRAYRVSEKDLLRQLLGRTPQAGQEVPVGSASAGGSAQKVGRLMRAVKKLRWEVFFLAQELIWLLGRWDTPALRQFIADFKPDLVFVPIYGRAFLCRIDLAVQKAAGVPMLGYISDDNYTLRFFSLDPFFWFNRLWYRRLVRQVVDRCRVLYVISEIQKKEYDRIFGKDCRILTKGYDFSVEHPSEKPPQFPLQLVYAGNIGANRWRSLAKIGRALNRINADGVKMQLTIYTSTALTSDMDRALNAAPGIQVAGWIPYCEVEEKQAQADLLVHVEPTDWVWRWWAHHGLSTKLVDYMHSYRPILAYGLEDQASIAHLKNQDAAFVASSEEELEAVLEKILADPSLLKRYAEKGWACGQRCHEIKAFRQMLARDFEMVLGEEAAQ